jgi:hypothetical protein
MAYTQGSLISATDYNNFIGETTTTVANQLNTMWATGNGKSGIGQTALPQVAQDSIVSYSSWNNLITAIYTLASHQGTVIAPISIAEDDTISTEYLPGSTVQDAFTYNLETLYATRNNCAAQGASIATTVTRRTTWNTQSYFVHTVTFQSGDAARNFFNAGGQLAINFSHPTGTGINSLWNMLAVACGTIVISSNSSGTVRVAGTNYNGITKVGGSGSPQILTTNNGYYALNTTYKEIFKQKASNGNYKYLNSFISVNVKSNGSQGSNGDLGNIITIITKFDALPDVFIGMAYASATVSAGSAVTVSARPPSTTYIQNTWGTPLIQGQEAYQVNSSYSTSGVGAYLSQLVLTSLPGGPGESLYTTPGTYSWTAPQGITNISVLCVGGGGGGGSAGGIGGPSGGGGAGGGVAWKNNITVVPGTSYTVQVGGGGPGATIVNQSGGNGGASIFTINEVSTVRATGGQGGSSAQIRLASVGGIPEGTFDGGGQGGAGGGSGTGTGTAGGGGGAGGYLASGGNGATGGSTASSTAAAGGTSGGGGGGGGAGSFGDLRSGGGGGIDVYGMGVSGARGTGNSAMGGKGGSGGQNGAGGLFVVPAGGNYGGGGGGAGGSMRPRGMEGGTGASGAVRIMWTGNSGLTRAFPNNNADRI